MWLIDRKTIQLEKGRLLIYSTSHGNNVAILGILVHLAVE